MSKKSHLIDVQALRKQARQHINEAPWLLATPQTGKRY
jgi:hypothetical protein